MTITLPGPKRYRDLGEVGGILTDLVRVCVEESERWAWAPFNGNPVAEFAPYTWSEAQQDAAGVLVCVYQPGCVSCEAGDHGCHNCHKVEPDTAKKCPACGSFEQVVIENEPWE